METGISWTDYSLNFWHGCKKVSPGCAKCYMYRDKARYKQDGSKVLKTQPATVNAKLKEMAEAARIRQEEGNTARIRVFTCSYSDFFIEEADPWRAEAWDIIRAYPQFDWQILTKRIERAEDCFPPDWGEGWPHVWLGVSAENQDYWNIRVPVLLDTPVAIRFVSVEPLIGPIYFERSSFNRERAYKIDWVIVGGESGNDVGPWGYRLCWGHWIFDIVQQCHEFNIPVFVKQVGTFLSKEWELKDRAGANMDEWLIPGIKIQEFPKTPYAIR